MEYSTQYKNDDIFTFSKNKYSDDVIKIKEPVKNKEPIKNDYEDTKAILDNILSYYQKGQFSHLLKVVINNQESHLTLFYWQKMYFKILTLQELIEYKMLRYHKTEKLNSIQNYFTMFFKSIQEMCTNLDSLKMKIIPNKYIKMERKRQSVFLFSSFGRMKDNFKALKTSLSSHNFNKKNKRDVSRNKNKAYNLTNEKIMNNKLIKNIIPEITEIIITQSLRNIANFSKYCINKGNILDAIGFLSIGQRLIQETFSFVSSPESLHYASYIYISLSSILISTKNFLTAKNYIFLALIMCFIELEQRFIKRTKLKLIDQFIKIDKESSTYINIINKTFFIISIAFYHLGVCYENDNNINSANSAYIQSRYFNDHNSDFYQIESNFDMYLDNIIQRAAIREKLVRFLIIEEKRRKMMADVPKMNKNALRKNYNEHDKKNTIKFERLKKIIENLKLSELDDDEPSLLDKIRGGPFSKRVGIPTKNIHILNYMLDTKFNEFLMKHGEIKLNNLSPEMTSKVQRQILSIKREELENFYKSTNNKNNNDIKTSINLDQTNEEDLNGNIKKHKTLTYSLSLTNIKENNINSNNVIIRNNKKLTRNKSANYNRNNSKKLFLKDNTKIAKTNINDNLISSRYKNNKTNKKLFLLSEKDEDEDFLNWKYFDILKFSNKSQKKFPENNSSKKNNFKESKTFNSEFSPQNLNIKNNYILNSPTIINSEKNKMNKQFSYSSFSNISNKNNTINKVNSSKNTEKKFLLNLESQNILKESCNNNTNNMTQVKTSKRINKKNKFNKCKSELFIKSEDDKLRFNKKLIRTKKYYESQYQREIKFQKELLKCKSAEFFNTNEDEDNLAINFNKQKVLNDCYDFYHSKLKEIIYNRNNVVLNEKEQKDLIEQKIKSQSELFKNPKNNNLIRELIKKMTLKEKKLDENQLMGNKNCLYIDKITDQLDKINQREKTIINKLKCSNLFFSENVGKK